MSGGTVLTGYSSSSTLIRRIILQELRVSIREVYAKELLLTDTDVRHSTSAGMLAEEILRRAFRSVESAGLPSGAAGRRYQHLDSAADAMPSTYDKEIQVTEAEDSGASGIQTLPRLSRIGARDKGVQVVPPQTHAHAQTDLVASVIETAPDEQHR